MIIVGASLAIEADSLDRVNILLTGQQQVLVSEVANVSKGPVILVIINVFGGPIGDKILSNM
ncbi:hypothetical protein TanjilG_07966 [Lupinus angustifolius]|uniref:Uncharacterized protein n=1 Tax=Lupinus angustifolius TaxID=3871 RepID=A0A4P1RLY0_LUPAN|nr:hypothetical protein TanjilG_07966 [Lupinus angustifolius]